MYTEFFSILTQVVLRLQSTVDWILGSGIRGCEGLPVGLQHLQILAFMACSRTIPHGYWGMTVIQFINFITNGDDFLPCVRACYPLWGPEDVLLGFLLKALLIYNSLLLLLSRFSCVWLCATPEMAAHQAPLSLGFSRQEHWSGLPFPSPMHESEKWKGSRSVMSNPSDPMDCSPPGSSIYGIFQARVLEWGAIELGVIYVCDER